MMYRIDLAVDVINSITFVKGKKVIGQLNFDYMQDLTESAIEDFQPPQTEITTAKTKKPENLWLTSLTM